MLVKLAVSLGGAFIGIKAPEIYIKNQITKRQQSMRLAFPDALDLLLICVESGMSIEQGFRRVSQEIGTQSIALAEELSLVTAELSFLQDRRQAYENFASRTGLETVKSVATALVQAERYGTPLGQALRVLAQEGRDERMNAAEKKAAALPPKLTVPMILFFLPVLLIVIITRPPSSRSSAGTDARRSNRAGYGAFRMPPDADLALACSAAGCSPACPRVPKVPTRRLVEGGNTMKNDLTGREMQGLIATLVAAPIVFVLLFKLVSGMVGGDFGLLLGIIVASLGFAAVPMPIATLMAGAPAGSAPVKQVH